MVQGKDEKLSEKRVPAVLQDLDVSFLQLVHLIGVFSHFLPQDPLVHKDHQEG